MRSRTSAIRALIKASTRAHLEACDYSASKNHLPFMSRTDLELWVEKHWDHLVADSLLRYLANEVRL